MTHLNEGDQAPDFAAQNQNGETISLADFRGKKVVLYFYPKDDTPGCTTEACNFRDNYQSLTSKGFEVIGVSNDNVKKHSKFATKYDLPFNLVADEDKTIVHAYGVYGLKKFMGREFDGIHRTTFVINAEGIIEAIIRKVKNKEATKQLLETLEATEA